MDGVILDYEGDNFNWIYEIVRNVLSDEGVEAAELTRSELDAFLGDQGVQACVEICNSHNVDARTVWTRLAKGTTEARARKIEQGDFRLFPEVKPVLEKLRSKNIEMALVSNAPEDAIELTLENYDLRKYFDYFRGISDFDDLSDRKPHPDHLNFARAELKRDPFVFIGDSESDVLAARNADMDAAWVNREGSSIDTRPDYEIEKLGGLLNIVGLKDRQLR